MKNHNYDTVISNSFMHGEVGSLWLYDPENLQHARMLAFENPNAFAQWAVNPKSLILKLNEKAANTTAHSGFHKILTTVISYADCLAMNYYGACDLKVVWVNDLNSLRSLRRMG